MYGLVEEWEGELMNADRWQQDVALFVYFVLFVYCICFFVSFVCLFVFRALFYWGMRADEC